MQDRYAGDIGDFGKYALLNRLCSEPGRAPVLSLGVLWYHFADVSNDGRHISYLEAPRYREFRPCAPDLWKQMRVVVHGDRSIAAVEASGALPDGTACYSEPLAFEPQELRADREVKRGRWLEAGRRAVRRRRLIFFDPDNGFAPDRMRPHHLKAPKYVFYGDLDRHIDVGQSLVVYHQLGRRNSHENQIDAKLDALRVRFPRVPGIFALRYRRGTARAYFVLPMPEHAELLAARACRLLASEWGRRGHFDLRIYE